jgi:hypothetical protein
MNKISFAIPIKDKIVNKIPLEVTNKTNELKQTNEKKVNPIINNSANYKKLAPNVYIFC